MQSLSEHELILWPGKPVLRTAGIMLFVVFAIVAGAYIFYTSSGAFEKIITSIGIVGGSGFLIYVLLGAYFLHSLLFDRTKNSVTIVERTMITLRPSRVRMISLDSIEKMSIWEVPNSYDNIGAPRRYAASLVLKDGTAVALISEMRSGGVHDMKKIAEFIGVGIDGSV